jgi:hypothetical protein
MRGVLKVGDVVRLDGGYSFAVHTESEAVLARFKSEDEATAKSAPPKAFDPAELLPLAPGPRKPASANASSAPVR